MAFQCTSPENGVFSLLTDLCTKTSSKYCNQNRISQKRLMKKMRSSAYEIILKKSSTKFTTKEGQPIADLISYYFVYQHSVRNIAEFKRSVELKKIISTLRKTDFGDLTCDVLNVIRFLIGVSNTINEDMSAEIFQNPFTFGLFEEMLPKPRREVFGSPEPYSYFPSHVFELPFSLKRDDAALDRHKSQTYTEYTVESFDSSSFLIDSSHSPLQGQSDVKSFLSPMSMASLTSTHLSPYSEDAMLNYPRLMAPRDLRIPTSSTHVKISLPSTDIKTDVKEIFSASSNQASIDIWELATQIDKGIPDDIWEIVAKMPKIEERQLINSSSREMCLWRETYAGDSSYLDVISEKQFIRHIMYLIFGVETKSFPFSRETNSFYMKEDLVLECISKEHIRGYISTLLLVGTYYIRLYNFSFNQSLEDHFHNHGLVYEAAREVVRRYLLEFRLVATEIYENCCKASNEGLNCMPTLLQILFHMEPLKYEMETMAAIYKVDQDAKTSLPHGAELMSYLFNEISLITHKNTTYTVYNSFYTVCKVYFKFIERYIFEGELDDIYNEFFIRKDNQYVNCRSKRYWDKGFHITQSVAIPRFLQSLAKCILLCGKSLRLLKLCNPSDPLVLLISSDHPSVTCCASFEDLERQQQVLDVYRTRCLFVTGELVTFDQILLKREAERKAFTEMASLKQAETMEKIIAERKRLAQLIIAEKQHSLRVLEAAMAEAKAAKSKAKQRERRRYELENAAEKATEEVDSKLKDVERNKLMAYYSKLNMEVEKSKMHTEWKIKRLQLDQSRMQLLSTEERNLKREKLELEHQKNEEIMAMSIQSIDYDKLNEETDNKEGIETNLESFTDKMHESVHSVLMQDVEEIIDVRECEESTPIAQTSTVMNAICNVAKSFFGVSKWNENQCDNNKQLDEQGNIVNTKTEDTRYTTSSSDIGSKLDAANDNLQFHKAKKEAMINKQNVMSHEFGHIDNENNTVIKHSSLLNLESVDEENNVRDNWSTFDYAKRNKLKVLGSEFDIIPTQSKIIVSEPRTDAQKEALLNKQKVLGVDFNLPAEPIILREPANQAQEEAVVNKQKVLGVEYNLPAESMILREPANQAQEEAVVNKQKVLGVGYNLPAEPMTLREPANQAQEEAIVNKQKVLGVEYNLPAEPIILKEPANQAQEEAIVNKQKVLGVKYNLPAEPIILREPENQAQEEAVVNKQKVLGVQYNLPAEPMILREPLNQAQEEAIVNKQKVLGVEYNLPAEPIILKEPANQAQEEAIVNKQKVLGVEYNLPAEQIILREPLNQAQELAVVNKQKVLGHDIAAVSVNFREPVTEAQEKAVRNKNKVMSSEYENTLAQSVRKESAKRSGLTLNLKPYGETSVVCSLGATPNAGVVTPGDLFPRLDLETPTTADIPQEAAITADIFTPRSETGKDLEPDKPKEKDFITSDGFNFTLMVDDENVESEITSEHQTADMTDISQSKNLESPETKIFKTKYNLFNILDGSYTLDDFDPFGIRDLKNFSQDYLSCKMDLDMSTSCYTHPSIIMEEVKKKPYANIFASHFDSEKEGEKKINCDNIATLTACLQRSVMLPLTYQLEVVNNSILTYFLVNLDMYEHMRSLKDYFFLMDGEFSRSICHNLFTKLVKTLNPQELLNFATLHNILDKALGSSISHVHKFSENLSFTITESPLSFQHSSPDVLQCLSLTYTVSWPLNIILSQEALLRYAKVFQFLIKMRRIFWVLGEDFEALKLSVKLSKQHSRKLLKSPQYISVQIYRHIMASMIRALDNYIVTTCILSSWKEFENDLKKARTLDDLNECHVVYIKKVLFRCLLNNRSTPVMKLLNDIFTVILKFSRVLKAGEWQQKQPNGCFTHTSFAQLVELFHLFEKLAKYLHKVVTKLMECGYQRHLVELLTMVNLNGYYEPEKAKDDHNSSVKSTV